MRTRVASLRVTSADSILVAVAVIFLHFQIVVVSGFPLTIAPFVVVLLLTVWRRVATKSLGAWLLLTALLLLPFVNMRQMTGATGGEATDFLRTYSLWCFSCVTLWSTVFLSSRRRSATSASGLPTVAFTCLIIIAAFCFVQVAAWRFMGNEALYNPFGSHQYLYAMSVSGALAGGLVRAKGLFLEPSFCALVILTLWVVCLLYRYKVLASSVVATLGIALTRSVVGLLAGAVLILVLWSTARRDQYWPIRFVSVLAVCILVATTLFDSGTYMGGRLLEVQRPSSSGYWRVTAPIIMMRQALMTYPTGVILGHSSQYVASFGVLRGNAVGSSVDNGIQNLVFYFGWLGLAGVLALAYLVVGYVLRRDQPAALATSYLLLALLFTGGILVPEYAFLQILVLQARRQSQLALTPVVDAPASQSVTS
jgi:hypothetical protein